MPYSLIIVDDEEKIRKGLVQLFPWVEWGFQVCQSFESSLQALDYICDHPLNVVLTDIAMPVMNGLEFAEKVRALNPEIFIVFFSGYRDFEYARKAIALNVFAYITKPINRTELRDVMKEIHLRLENALGNPAAEQDTETYCQYYDQILNQARAYVSDNYADVNLEKTASVVGLSAGYLSKLFKQKGGINFSDYLLGIKMRNAARLLNDVSLKSYEVAYKVGYDNPKNFSRAFKQYYGVSPWEYRENGLPAKEDGSGGTEA